MTAALPTRTSTNANRAQPEASALANACATHDERLVVWALLDTWLRLSVEIIGPRLHHVPPLRQILGEVVRRAGRGLSREQPRKLMPDA